MTAEKWLRGTIPIQGLLLLSQLVTGLNEDRIPSHIYTIVHIGGSLLVALVTIHLVINRNWI